MEKDEVLVITQNVDGLHRAAGSRNVVEVHGNADSAKCTVCHFWCPNRDLADENGDLRQNPPKCPNCGSLLRPRVVLFDELLPAGVVDQLSNLDMTKFDMVFTIGTTSQFSYVEGPIKRAKAMDIPTVEINPEKTDMSELVDFHFVSSSSQAMERLWRSAPQNP